MKVILQQDVSNLGRLGEVVKVRDGYGRNYLIPRGLAVLADEKNVARIVHMQKIAEAKAARELAEAKAQGEKLGLAAVTIRREAGADGKLFGSVTNRDIADALVAEGYTVDRKQVVVDDSIRAIGKFMVPVKLHRDVSVQVTVYVVQ